MTNQEIIDYCCAQVKDSTTTAKSVIQAGINRGLLVLRKKLRRLYAIETRTFTISAGQSVYQTPEDCIRALDIKFIDGGSRDPLHYVDSDSEWDIYKQKVNQSGRPQFWRMISSDMFELWPVPTSGTGEIRMQTRAKPLSQLDYTTGTVTLTQGSANVVGTGTSFSAAMVGRSLRLANGNGDLNYYRIQSYTDATHITLENNFAGTSISGAAYRIGEVPNIPADFHYALADHGMRNYWMWRKDRELAGDAYADFLEVKDSIEEDDQPTTSSVIESKQVRGEADVPFYKRTPRSI